MTRSVFHPCSHATGVAGDLSGVIATIPIAGRTKIALMVAAVLSFIVRAFPSVATLRSHSAARFQFRAYIPASYSPLRNRLNSAPSHIPEAPSAAVRFRMIDPVDSDALHRHQVSCGSAGTDVPWAGPFLTFSRCARAGIRTGAGCRQRTTSCRRGISPAQHRKREPLTKKESLAAALALFDARKT